MLLIAATSALAQKAFAQSNTLRIYDTALFYGGYADTSVFTQPSAPGVIRFKTSLFTKKITDAELAQIGDSLTLNIYARATCDNYDRAAHVVFAFVPKGQATYSTSDTAVKHLEIARFITPFMNKNIQPDTVPYSFQINNVASMLREKSIVNNYDVWMEFSIFGVVQAGAIAGCTGRRDVYYGTVDLVTNTPAPQESNNIIVPVYNQHAFNNYQSGATDSLTTTVKTVTFTLDTTSYNTAIYLITSNHGAGTNGEEYNRRNHFVYLDGTQILQYKPGFTTCEQYRVYNTQANGIYGASAKTDAQWQSFSNWCPGAYIPIRVINVGTLAKGTHTFKIAVPDAVFPAGDGNFPLSLYVQGKTQSTITAIGEIKELEANTSLYPNPAKNELSVRTNGKINTAVIFNMLGQKVWEGNTKTIDVARFQNGVYYMKIQFSNDITIVKSFVKSEF